MVLPPRALFSLPPLWRAFPRTIHFPRSWHRAIHWGWAAKCWDLHPKKRIWLRQSRNVDTRPLFSAPATPIYPRGLATTSALIPSALFWTAASLRFPILTIHHQSAVAG